MPVVFFRCVRLLLLGALLPAFTGCSSAYYGALEKVGYAKRDILVERMRKAQQSQAEAKEQFASALDQFAAVAKFSGGDLAAKYRELDATFKRSQARASAVRERIDAVSDVAEALFREWKSELYDYQSASLRRESERQFELTRKRYDALMVLMRRAADRMDPVLNSFGDQVLFLKHNLNARALASLTSEQRTLESDISKLIAEMESAIREAETFIRTLETG